MQKLKNHILDYKLDTMTLVACLVGTNGLVLAADSRGTIGDPRGLTAINDTQRKLFRLTKFVGILSYGSGEVAAQMISEVQSNIEDNEARIDAILVTARSVMRDRYQDWFKNVVPDDKQVIGFILGGLDESWNPKAFYLTSNIDFAPQLVTTGIALGGVPQYATYLVHRLYNPAMNREHLMSLAVYIIAETATQDPKVGSPIRLAQISKDNGFEEVDEKPTIAIKERNDEQNLRLREFFFGGQNKA